MHTIIAMQVEMGCHLMMLFVLLLHVRPHDHGGQRLLHGLCIRYAVWAFMMRMHYMRSFSIGSCIGQNAFVRIQQYHAMQQWT